MVVSSRSGVALRECDLERAIHLPRNPLHSPVAYANFAGDFDDAFAGTQTTPSGYQDNRECVFSALAWEECPSVRLQKWLE